jgi:hypothetical protein
LLKGKTVAIDATALEANAALQHLVRRDTGCNRRERYRQESPENALLSAPQA